jgi:ferritin-like metal-binding protein YciE
MEQEALEMCKRQAERIENYPELAARVAQHLEETKGQIEKLEKCFALLDTSPSTVKSTIGKLGGNLQAFSSSMSSDEIIKNSMNSYTFEHMEIGSYKILIAAAQQAGQQQIAKYCEEILAEEQDMADWLENHLASTTTRFLERDARDVRAKV